MKLKIQKCCIYTLDFPVSAIVQSIVYDIISEKVFYSERQVLNTQPILLFPKITEIELVSNSKVIHVQVDVC